MRILLASGSPRRKQLLEELGHRVTVVRPDFDEATVTEPDPKKLVEALAAGKGRSVQPPEDGLLVAADTVVVFRGKVLGKPADPEEAFRMLKAMSGQSHQVYTGVYLAKEGKERIFAEEAEVRFRTLTDAEIEAYIATGSPMDKAGAYGIQDSGFVAGYQGSFNNIMGFPTEKFQEEAERI